MKHGRKLIAAAVAAVLLLFFFPIPFGPYEDGGTREFRALTYKIVIWNRLVGESSGEDGALRVNRYRKTSVYWFPDNNNRLDELWKMEAAKGESSEK